MGYNRTSGKKYSSKTWLRKACLGAVSLLLGGNMARAQVAGGQFALEFLRMSNSPHISALGGISVANPDQDISLAVQNPAMMRAGLHNQLQLNYNNFIAGIKMMNLQYGYHAEKINTSFFFGLQYLNYGDFVQTSTFGTEEGIFHGEDYAITLGASRSYGQHWRYGAGLKFAHSFLGPTVASAVLADVGINYYDTASLWDFGAVAKNMGVMIKKFNPNATTEPIPFDLQIGVSKRFKHLPLRLFSTVHHLYKWDIRYDNPDDNTNKNVLGGSDSADAGKSHFTDKLFRHFIFGAELTLGSRLTITGSYNFQHRREMALSTLPGTTGFAFGAGLNLNKFQVHYGRTYYHISGPYNEIGLTMVFNKLFGLGNIGEKMNWNKVYNDWE